MSDLSVRQIVGEQLSAVSFVQDYVEFHFDGPVVRALSGPIAHDATGETRFPAPGSRDRLCAFIGRDVVSCEVVEGHELRIAFARGTLVVPLDAVRTDGPEAMHFQDSSTGPVQVWNVE